VKQNIHELKKMHKMKKIILYIGIIFISSIVNISAQTHIDSLPEDPLDNIDGRLSSPVRNNNLSFLLQEDSCYDFRVANIISLSNGYIILARTKVESFNIWAYIVTSKKHPDIKIIQKKIKKGKNYKLHLRRYFLLPAWVGIERGYTVDIMLGNKTMSINQNGDYSYLFTSFDIEGLYQIKSREVVIRKQKFEEEEINIRNSILPFLEYISYGKQVYNLFDIVDTLQIKRSLNRYGHYWWWRNPSNFDYSERKYEWSIGYPVKKHDWMNKDGMKRDTLNPKIYEEVFWGMLKEQYKLPIDSQDMDRDFLYSSIRLKLLYYSPSDIYTVQVIWKIPNVKKTFIAIINIQKKKDTYKIIGFNKPYRGYRLYLEEKNERFIPE